MFEFIKKIKFINGIIDFFSKKMGFFGRWFIVPSLFIATALFAAGIVVIIYYSATLPEFDQLAEYKPPVTARVHAGDGRLLAEFAAEKRIFLPIEAIPKLLRDAFVAAEDQRFYKHPGIDIIGIIRAIKTDIAVVVTGKGQLSGASTITQQVAKNFLLTNQKTLQRKIREAILAVKIERILSKDDILELYLNEIYLGQRSFGVGSAALQYFDKSLDELTIDEVAYMAALPKGPNNYNIEKFPEAAKDRRDWVIGRMLAEGFISEEQAIESINKPLETEQGRGSDTASAAYFVEETRRRLIALYKEEGLYEGGFSIRTSLNPRFQDIGRNVLRKSLRGYDRRHGYRGVVMRLEEGTDIARFLEETPVPLGSDSQWILAVVRAVSKDEAKILLPKGKEDILERAALKWARSQLDLREVVGDRISSSLIGEELEPEKRRLLGPVIYSAHQILKPRDVILVSRNAEGKMQLEQVPEIEGALVALDPHTGRVLAMVGGWDFKRSQFNRVTQAKRQPGSAFKPFVYLTALEKGFTPATRILDAPFVAQGSTSDAVWKPDNFSQRFYGPSPMRVGIERSRNLMTVRLADAIGIEYIADTVKRFGIIENMPHQLVMALGSGETTLLNLTTAYAMLANGGKKIIPSLIDRVQDRDGITLFKNEKRLCFDCNVEEWNSQEPPKLEDTRENVTKPEHAYQIVSMLEGVIRRGTGSRIRRVLSRPLAGKTGTTNRSRDTWFVGFSPNLVVGVFVGFDTPRTLGVTPWGGQETASNVAAPIFADFMQQALAGKPIEPFRVPDDIILVRINAETGGLSSPGDRRTVLEAFQLGSEPVDSTPSPLIGSYVKDGQSGETEIEAEQEVLEGLY